MKTNASGQRPRAAPISTGVASSNGGVPRRSSIAASMLVCAVALLVGGFGHAAPDRDSARERARALFVQGKAQYARGEYRAAITSFRAASKLRPSPLLDFNVARCHERLGDARAAVASYRRYLRGQPDAGNREEVEASIARLTREIEQRRRGSDPYEDLEAEQPASAPTAAASEPAGAREDDGDVEEGDGASSQPADDGDPESGQGREAAGDERDPDRSAGAAGPINYPHEAEQPWPGAGQQGRAAGSPAGPRPPGPWPPGSRAPFYKTWAFWGAIGVATVITGFIIGIAVSRSSDAGSHSPSITSPLAGPLPAEAGLQLRF